MIKPKKKPPLYQVDPRRAFIENIQHEKEVKGMLVIIEKLLDSKLKSDNRIAAKLLTELTGKEWKVKTTQVPKGADLRLYKIWSNMKNRCYNPNSNNYWSYGRRKVKVCDEWQEFQPFAKWAWSHGYQHGLTIHRQNDGDYCPESCVWITRSEHSSMPRMRCKRA